MNRKTLEALGLEKETIDRILDEHHQDLNREKASAQIQKDRAEELRGQLDARNKAYDELKAKTPENLQADYDSLKSEYESAKADWQAKEERRTYERNREDFFRDVDFTDPFTRRGVYSAFDEQAFKYTDSGFEGAEEWLKTLREENPGAFRDAKKIPKFAISAESGAETNMTPEQFKGLTYMERVKLKEEQPDAYRALAGS